MQGRLKNCIAVANASFLALFALGGCRTGNENSFVPDAAAFDAGVDSDPPGTLCLKGAPDPFDNHFSPFKGGEDEVKVDVNVFANFECSHCADFAAAAEKLWASREDYQRGVRLAFHHFPWDTAESYELHAAAAAAAKQSASAFWKLHDFLFERLSAKQTPPTIGEIRDYASQKLGLDMTRFEQDLSSIRTLAFLTWDKNQGQSAGASGTPAVFVCGEKIKTANTQKVIDGLLKR